MLKFNKNGMNTNTSKLKLLMLTLLTGAMIASGYVATVSAVDYRAQIQALEEQKRQYQAQADALRAKADTLQNALNAITAEKNQIQSEIDINSAKVDQLNIDITSNEEKLERQKRTISKTIAQIYINSSTSPIEILASSKSVGEYVSEQEVRTSVRNQMKVAMDEVKRLRDELKTQKKALEDTIAQQNAQREQLAAKEAEQANLVAKTRGEEAAYQSIVANLEEQQQAAEAALAASLSAGSYKVAPAGFVNAGDIVGSIGNTGLSSGPHLHLEVRQGGSVTNPSPYIRVQPIAMPPGYISQEYWNYDPIYVSGHHPGRDYATNQGAPIYAIDSGNMYRGCSDQMLGTYGNPYGYVAIVEHASGVISVYAHMSGGPAACNYNTYY